jgi:hypothetical protein
MSATSLRQQKKEAAAESISNLTSSEVPVSTSSNTAPSNATLNVSGNNSEASFVVVDEVQQ